MDIILYNSPKNIFNSRLYVWFCISENLDFSEVGKTVSQRFKHFMLYYLPYVAVNSIIENDKVVHGGQPSLVDVTGFEFSDWRHANPFSDIGEPA